jgi:hypothetical protein
MTNHPNRGRKYFGSIRVLYIGAKSINAVLTPLEAMKLIEWLAGSINSNAQTITLSTRIWGRSFPHGRNYSLDQNRGGAIALSLPTLKDNQMSNNLGRIFLAATIVRHYAFPHRLPAQIRRTAVNSGASQGMPRDHCGRRYSQGYGLRDHGRNV